MPELDCIGRLGTWKDYEVTGAERFEAGVRGPTPQVWIELKPSPGSTAVCDGCGERVTSIHDTEGTNEAYFNDPKYNKAIVAAGRLTGAARTAAYAALDTNITKNAAPWASYLNLTQRDFISKSTGCYLFQPVFLMDWAVTCKK